MCIGGIYHISIEIFRRYRDIVASQLFSDNRTCMSSVCVKPPWEASKNELASFLKRLSMLALNWNKLIQHLNIIVGTNAIVMFFTRIMFNMYLASAYSG